MIVNGDWDPGYDRSRRFLGLDLTGLAVPNVLIANRFRLVLQYGHLRHSFDILGAGRFRCHCLFKLLVFVSNR
ncbi:MAG: hypothetical protein K0U84_01940, partial [Actinomycetia bacterium]|nr:hypothetical protein [Actinomycetes bacterium]